MKAFNLFFFEIFFIVVAFSWGKGFNGLWFGGSDGCKVISAELRFEK
jgi:hypothetical protein